MRIVVTGARGYIGSRVVPELLTRGHEVIATATSDPFATDAQHRHRWVDDVEWRAMDATVPAQVRGAIADADAVLYLVHSLDKARFAERDRLAAEIMRDAVDEADVSRVVYLSGLVPSSDELSEHLASRLEVEQILLESSAATASLRAGVVLGAGSTSFEIIRQIAAANVVLPVPSWLRSKVQPIGVVDAVDALVTALEDSSVVGDWDIGCPTALPYGDLIATLAHEAGMTRVRLDVPVPPALVTLGAPWVTTAPAGTVRALMDSLRHEMVCRPERHWRPGVDTPLATALAASLGRSQDPRLSAHLRSPGDPSWTDPGLLAERMSGIGLALPGPTRAWARLAEHHAASIANKTGVSSVLSSLVNRG